MTYDLKQQLRDLANCRHDDLSIGYEAADRIEQLEAERDQLLKQVKMLRDVLQFYMDNGICEQLYYKVKQTLAATEPKE